MGLGFEVSFTRLFGFIPRGDIELHESLRLISAPRSESEEIFISKLIKQRSKLINVISRFITKPSTVIQNLEEEDDPWPL